MQRENPKQGLISNRGVATCSFRPAGTLSSLPGRSLEIRCDESGQAHRGTAVSFPRFKRLPFISSSVLADGTPARFQSSDTRALRVSPRAISGCSGSTISSTPSPPRGRGLKERYSGARPDRNGGSGENRGNFQSAIARPLSARRPSPLLLPLLCVFASISRFHVKPT